MLDAVTIRTLGGIRVLDHVTNRPLDRPVTLSSKALTFARTLSGIYQIRSAPGFAEYARTLKPVPVVAGDEFDFEIQDDARQFLPVAASIDLPRNSAPNAVANRVDTPVEIALPSAPGRALTAGLTICRASVEDTNGDPVRGALVEVLRAGATDVLAWGLSAQNGEALIPILGIPILQTVDPGPNPNDEEELTSAETPVRLRASAEADQPWPANITTLRAGGGGLRTVLDDSDQTLTAGGTLHRLLTLDLT